MNENTPSVKELHSQAQEAEAKGNATGATELYLQMLQQDALNQDAYNSLMKLYRRAKAYKKEMAIINKAIKSWEAFYKKHRPRHSKGVDAISQKLNKALGLIGKNSDDEYSPEPIASWKKRRAVVEKRLK